MSDVETKAVLIAVNQLSIDLIKAVKSGGGVVASIEALLADANLRSSIEAAASNISSLLSELKALTGADYLDLAQAQIALIPQIVAALEAPAPVAAPAV